MPPHFATDHAVDRNFVFDPSTWTKLAEESFGFAVPVFQFFHSCGAKTKELEHRHRQ
jgi:hypothetical protein